MIKDLHSCDHNHQVISMKTTKCVQPVIQFESLAVLLWIQHYRVFDILDPLSDVIL